MSQAKSGYGAGAKILSVGIASTGMVTFAYFSVASHALNDPEAYARISLLWSVLFVIVSVIYRPIEQLLSRTIADRRARGFEANHPLRTPMLIQGAFALTFLAIALIFRDPIQNELFDGFAALYWVLVIAVLAYAASYFARGWLAGHQWFALYGGLVFIEATARLLFAVAVLVGIAEGQSVVAMGMAAAPFVSLVVVPLAFSRRPKESASKKQDELGLARGGRFAVAVLAIMLAEQTLLNAGVIAADLTATDAAVTGYVFSALLIARAPLQLFQAVQGSLLPHLAGLEAKQGKAEFEKAIRITILAIAGFALAVALGLLVLGPFAMDLLFDDDKTLRPVRARRGGARHGLPSRRGDAQPGRARARPRRHRRDRVAAGRRRVPRVDVRRRDRRRAPPRRGRVPRRGELAVCPPGGRVPTTGQRVTPGGLSRRGGRTCRPA